MQEISQQHHYISIVEPSIAIGDNFAYNEGVRRKVFLQDANGSDYQGRVWAGDVRFVDFFHPNASQYWQDILDHFRKQVNFTGVWLDMNEFANFCDGPCVSSGASAFDYSRDLPWNPSGAEPLEQHSVSLNATSFSGKYAHLHGLMAVLQQKATNEYLRGQKLIPFIISRANSPGSSRHAFHWTGDNYASFEYLKLTIANNIQSNFWGIQMVGPDICGFGGNSTEELCARWFQLGVFSPFVRSHNANDSSSQEPYALGPTLLETARQALQQRYSLIRQLYTEFVAKRGLGTIYRPLFMEFDVDSVMNSSVL